MTGQHVDKVADHLASTQASAHQFNNVAAPHGTLAAPSVATTRAACHPDSLLVASHPTTTLAVSRLLNPEQEGEAPHALGEQRCSDV